MRTTRSRVDARTDGVEEAAEQVRRGARSLRDAADLGALADAVGDAQYVLLGEASHGTSEFYRWRARLTARLVRDHGFSFVSVEGDWPPCYGVNEYVKGAAGDERLRTALDRFDRWPTWMWANWEVAEFFEWLREFNADREKGERVGFYGLDVYSLFESMAEVVDYLEGVDRESAKRARDAYQCFEPYGDDAREYARSTRLVPADCEDEVVEALTELRRSTGPDERDREGVDARFDAEQNALVARDAEAYYRAMASGSEDSWNVRDRHMVETLERLVDHHGPDAKAVVWAHNTHVGDARATDMADRGKVNVGQLVREAHDESDVAVVGFGTHRGSVVAGAEWGAPMERMRVPRAREGSYGDVFHRAGVGDSFIRFDDAETNRLAEERGHRAIGVVYDPDRELGNYVPTVLTERYDAFVHVEESAALHPLHLEPEGKEQPEAYPWGI